MNHSFKLKKKHDFNYRQKEANRILTKYPDRIPIIVEKYINSKEIPDINKNKYLVPTDLTFGQFLFIIRKRIKLTPEKAIFMFTENGTLLSSFMSMSQVYDEHKSDCGFLFMIYSGESTFG